MDDVPRRITEWLDKNYTKKLTKNVYFVSLKLWAEYIYGKDSVGKFMGYSYDMGSEVVRRQIEKRINKIEEGIERYFSELDDRNFLNDYKGFINWMRNEGYANLSIRSMSGKVKLFFGRQDPICKIDDEDWSQIKRTLLPKSTRASTHDDILTKEQLKMVLQHLSIHRRALALFLLSTGVRIGAASQLKMIDINLYSDPPEVNIREEYTKGEVGGRVMWFSYEAKDAIIEWHKTRKNRKKAGGFGEFDEDNVFNNTKRGFTTHWNKSLKKADGGQIPPVLAKRDPSTKKRVHVYHVHTLRKFFRTNMGSANVPDMIVHAWMGHKAYLNEYDRLGRSRMAEIYKEHMDVVTVHGVGIDEKARAKYKEMIEKSEKLAEQTIEDRVFVDMVGIQLKVFGKKSETQIKAMKLDEKKILIIDEVAKLKRDLIHAREQNIEHLEKALNLITPTEKQRIRVKDV